LVLLGNNDIIGFGC